MTTDESPLAAIELAVEVSRLIDEHLAELFDMFRPPTYNGNEASVVWQVKRWKRRVAEDLDEVLNTIEATEFQRLPLDVEAVQGKEWMDLVQAHIAYLIGLQHELKRYPRNVLAIATKAPSGENRTHAILINQAEGICRQVSQLRGENIDRDVANAFNQLRQDALDSCPPEASRFFSSRIPQLDVSETAPYTISPDTAQLACTQLLTMLRSLQIQPATENTLQRVQPGTSKVFIVHGHDGENALRLERLLKGRWNLIPIVLADQPSKGRTIIEKFEDEAADCAFAVILYTPDDFIEKLGTSYHQARPNVLFEIGWFYGRLGRERVCLVCKHGTNIPSDLSGVGRVEFSHQIEECALALEAELRAAKMPVP
jgi:predicted nucleotide-binding protein